MNERESEWICPADLRRKYHQFCDMNGVKETTINVLAAKYLLIKCGNQSKPMIHEESWLRYMELQDYHRELSKHCPTGKDPSIKVPEFLKSFRMNHYLFKSTWYKACKLLDKEIELEKYNIFTVNELNCFVRQKIIYGNHDTHEKAYFIHYACFLDLMALRDLNMNITRFNPKKCP